MLYCRSARRVSAEADSWRAEPTGTACYPKLTIVERPALSCFKRCPSSEGGAAHLDPRAYLHALKGCATPTQDPAKTLRGYGVAAGARVLVLGATTPAQSGALASAEAAHLSSQARAALPACVT